jgi:NAD(P)-dependent dehydrogenase (short-subunit alcohol dehydrogenase family)
MIHSRFVRGGPRARLGIAAMLLMLAAPGCATATAQQTDAPTRPKPGQRVVLVTGSTDGLGRELALRLAADGAHVIVHGRNRERGTAVVEEIALAGRGSARFYAADFSSLAELRTFAVRLLADYPRIDVLINNAGIWLAGRPERELSADGHELHFAVNYLAGYLLTRLLLPRLIESAPARIINVASGAQRPIDFADPMLTREYVPMRGYAQSKLAQVMFTIDLAEELAGRGVTVAALHPATLMDTHMVRESGIAARSTVDEGARAVLQLVNSPDVRSGDYYNGLVPARANAQAYDAAARAQLRMLSEQLTGVGRAAQP